MMDLVLIGTVVKAHGIRGEVVVDLSSDVEGRLAVGSEVVVGGTSVTVKSSRPHQGRLLVGFSHVPDRTAAEALRGAKVEAPGADLGDEEHFYAHELVGVPVVGPEGADLGTVADLVLLPAAAGYDLLEVTHPDGHRWLLPAADDLVEAVDVDGRLELHVLALPPGLVEPAQADEVPRDPSDEDLA